MLWVSCVPYMAGHNSFSVWWTGSFVREVMMLLHTRGLTWAPLAVIARSNSWIVSAVMEHTQQI